MLKKSSKSVVLTTAHAFPAFGSNRRFSHQQTESLYAYTLLENAGSSNLEAYLHQTPYIHEAKPHSCSVPK